MKGYDRRIFNAIINPAVKPAKGASRNRKFLAFDWLPTILAALGVKVEGERLALGTNLFSGKKTLVEELGSYDAVNLPMEKPSLFYNTEIRQLCDNMICTKGHAHWHEKISE